MSCLSGLCPGLGAICLVCLGCLSLLPTSYIASVKSNNLASVLHKCIFHVYIPTCTCIYMCD